MMLVLALITWLAPGTMIRFFSKDAAVIQFGSDYLRIVAFNFVAAGIVLPARACSGIGQHDAAVYSARRRACFFLRCRRCCSRARRGLTSNSFGTFQSDRRCSRPA